MKNKAITRKVVVENGAAMVAIEQHISKRASRHHAIVKKATEAGIVGTLTEVNKHHSLQRSISH